MTTLKLTYLDCISLPSGIFALHLNPKPCRGFEYKSGGGDEIGTSQMVRNQSGGVHILVANHQPKVFRAGGRVAVPRWNGGVHRSRGGERRGQVVSMIHCGERCTAMATDMRKEDEIMEKEKNMKEKRKKKEEETRALEGKKQFAFKS